MVGMGDLANFGSRLHKVPLSQGKKVKYIYDPRDMGQIISKNWLGLISYIFLKNSQNFEN